MFDILVTDPDLPLMDRLDALREGFQRMTSVENAPRALTKGANHALGFGILQEHDCRSAMRFPRLLKDFHAGIRAVLKLFTDQGDVCFVRFELADNLLRTAGQGFYRKTLTAMRKRTS